MKTSVKALLATVAFAAGTSLALATDAKENYTNLCAKCHGADGAGKTKIGAKLKVKDYTTAEGQKFTDEEGAKAVLEGVTKDGKEQMPASKEKISADEAKAVVAYVRTLKK